MAYHFGDRYYTVRKSGVITPKLVLSLPFTLGEDSFFSLEEALAEAKPRLERFLNSADSLKLRTEGQLLLDMYSIGAKLLEPQFETVPINFSNELTQLMGLEQLEVDLAKIPDPNSYLQPGYDVFVAITPRTHYTLSPSWRPASYFILRVRLKRVSWTKYGIQHDLDSYYQIHAKADICATLAEARTRLCELIIEQVPAVSSVDRKKIQYFNSKSEKLSWANWHERQKR